MSGLAYYAILNEVKSRIANNGEGFYLAIGANNEVIDCFKIIIPNEFSTIIQGFGDKAVYTTEDLVRLFIAEETVDFIKIPKIWNLNTTP